MSTRTKYIYISHGPPAPDSHYYRIEKVWKARFVFFNPIRIEGLGVELFRQQGISPLDFTSIIFTGRTAAEHFLRLIKEMNLTLDPNTRYLCVGDAVAKVIQQGITNRRRRIYSDAKSPLDLWTNIKRHSTEKYLYPTGEQAHSQLVELMQQHGIHVQPIQVYRTVYADFPPEILQQRFSILGFTSPASVHAWFHAMPNFKQRQTKVIVLGQDTLKAAVDMGLRVEITAQAGDVPSLPAAIELYLSRKEKKHPTT
ncbi:MAG: uroporphyrinogen-III synthase [Bacteroidia bacterium]